MIKQETKKWQSIEREALLASEELSEPSTTHCFTDLFNLATNLGITRIEEADIPATSLLILRPDNKYTLFLQPKMSVARKRFSIAHELGHLLLRPILGDEAHHWSQIDLSQDHYGRRIEHLCNKMAANILMPPKSFSQAAEQYGWTLETATNLARSLKSSSEAAIRRLVDLAPQPSGVIAWEASKPDSLSWKWSYSNSKMRASRISFKPGAWLSQYPSLKQAYESSQRTLGTETMILLIGSKGTKSASYQQMSCESMLVGSERYRQGYTLIRPE